jgi:hypothetical protein
MDEAAGKRQGSILKRPAPAIPLACMYVLAGHHNVNHVARRFERWCWMNKGEVGKGTTIRGLVADPQPPAEPLQTSAPSVLLIS